MVDNYLRSLPTPSEAKALVDKMRSLLANGAFEMTQWVNKDSTVVANLPAEVKSEATELWLLERHSNPQDQHLV